MFSSIHIKNKGLFTEGLLSLFFSYTDSPTVCGEEGAKAASVLSIRRSRDYGFSGNGTALVLSFLGSC